MRNNLLKELILFYFKQMRKNVFYLVGMLIIPAVLVIKIMGSLQESLEYMMFPDAISGVVIPLQAVMLIVSVYMYRLTSDEAQYKNQMTFPNIMWIQFQRVIALLFTHMLFSLCFLLAGLIPIILYFFIHHIESWNLYRQLLTHSFIFYLLPLLIAALWGINSGLLFGKRRIGILILFSIWVLLSPLNTEFFSDFFLKKGFNDLNAFFFMGPLQPEVVYYELTGFLSGNALLLKNFLILIFNLVITMLIISSWALKRDQRFFMMFAAFLIAALTISSAPFAMKNDQLVFDRSFDMETKQHYKEPYLFDFSTAASMLDYDITDVQLTLNKQTKNEIKASAVYGLNSNTESIVFSLYHLYKVTSVEVDGSQTAFHQTGDFIEIDAVKTNQPLTVTVRFVIQNSSRFPITDQVTFLPAWLNWYPTKQAYPNSKLGRKTFEPVIDRVDPMSIKLNYQTQDQMITNLNEGKKHQFTGKQSGITLIEGSFGNYEIGDRKVIVDQSWTNPASYWPPVEELLHSINDITERKFGQSNKLPDTIILLAPNHEKFSYLDNEHLLLHVSTNLRLDQDVTEVVRAYMLAAFWSKTETDSQIQPTQTAFNDALAFWMSVELGLSSPSAPDPFFLEAVLPTEEFSKSKEKINQFMELSHEDQLIFLKQWYNELTHASNM